jgi:DtxR family Mn-dependent transcriptional regulator
MTFLGILVIALLAGALLAMPRVGGLALWRRVRSYRERARDEDALKHILAWQHRSQLASLESLAGTLRMAPLAALRLATRLQSAGWIEIGASGIGLTASGERRALQVVRAHRLWERHLSDDANMPMARLHQAAERAEHSLSSAEVAKLDAHLGHPQHDPHGDPIPRADGQVAALDAVSLNEWPAGTPARIVHVEDEPHAVFRKILSAGLRPSLVVRILEKGPGRLLLQANGAQRRIDRAVAASIDVVGAPDEELLPPDATRLSDLAIGDVAEVLELGPQCLGFSRRRLLDLGLTPGATVQATLDNTFGDPRAFSIRGTTIALRREQAEQVWIRPLADSPTRGARS